MGFAITWFAVREENAEAFLHWLRLAPTGETEEFPESPILTARLTTGWRLLWCDEYDCGILPPRKVATASQDFEVLMCLVEEHVMASSAELWSRGRQVWRLAHEGENGPKGLEVEGNPPGSLPAIRDEMERAQEAAGGDEADVDYLFEIPLLVAKALVGFKHDEDCPHLTDGNFVVLKRSHGA